jgi:hypothetical protein
MAVERDIRLGLASGTKWHSTLIEYDAPPPQSQALLGC